MQLSYMQYVACFMMPFQAIDVLIQIPLLQEHKENGHQKEPSQEPKPSKCIL